MRLELLEQGLEDMRVISNVLRKEIMGALKMKGGKAASMDGIFVEVLKKLRD